MNERSPLLSVVILNWNAASYIVSCVRSVLSSAYAPLEVILIDNASTDGSIALLKAALRNTDLSRITFIENNQNIGAARALNQGACRARGKYISFVATDTTIDPGCFPRLIGHLEQDDSIGGVSAALYLMDDPGLFDSVGEYISRIGLLVQRHADDEQRDRGQFNHPAEILSTKGTALTVRADAFRAAGMYPEDYFMFLEETDLCWRIWLAGYRVVFVPGARIYHASGVSIKSHTRSSYLVKYYGARNYLYTLIKNYGLLRCAVIVPLHALLWFALACVLLLRGRAAEAGYIIKALLWVCLHARPLLRARRGVQAGRVRDENDLMRRIERSVSLRYLLARVAGW
jgi:hypothetical protein